jgi:hypothetical protein
MLAQLLNLLARVAIEDLSDTRMSSTPEPACSLA